MPCIKDLNRPVTDSQEWWTDFGPMGPLFFAWLDTGPAKYRSATVAAAPGEGQQGASLPQQLARTTEPRPKPRRLLWPIKSKVPERENSRADLDDYRTVKSRIESMGFKTLGFAGSWKTTKSGARRVVNNWGLRGTWLADEPLQWRDRDREKPLGDVHMGLIYVNPEGLTEKNPIPIAADRDYPRNIRPYGA